MVRQIGAKKVPRLPLLGPVLVGQLDQVIFALPDADVDEDFVAEPVCYPQRNTHRLLSPTVPCSLPVAPRWFDGLTMEEIRATTLEFLLKNERRWGTPISILNTSFEWNDTVVEWQLSWIVSIYFRAWQSGY